MNNYYQYIPNTRDSLTNPVLKRPTLRYGSQGEFVKQLQMELKQLMFYNGNIDGYFGNETLKSVKAFQINNKLTTDGIVGKDTWSALIYLYSPLAICGETPSDNVVYTVQKGDTLWSISRRFNTTVTVIKSYNNLTSDLLSIGQQLIIPDTNDITTYTVQKGDTLWSIANRFNTTVADIKSLNNLSSNLISIGQVLKIRS